MTLRQKQSIFLRNVGLLIQYAYEQGYELTAGDAYRDPRVFGEVGDSEGYGRKKSLHKMRLAIDLNLFKNGRYLQATSDHKPLGDYWESLDINNCWGGRFNDGNHYSMKHEGMR